MYARRATRPLWLLGLLAAIIFTAITVLGQHDRAGGSGFASRLTFWVADAQADPDAATIAQQVSGYWPLDADTTAGTVGLLPGNASSAISDFFQTTGTSTTATGNLLVLTTTTLSNLAAEKGSTPKDGDVVAETAGSAPDPAQNTAALTRAPIVAVLARDPIEIAVSASSPIRSTAQLLALNVADPDRKLFGISSDPWLTDNLAALLATSHFSGHRVYTQYPTAAGAVAGLETGASMAVLAPRTALAHALAAHKVRLLGWPSGTAPQAWVALAAPLGMPASEVARLRAQARRMEANPQWRGLLAGDGLTPVDLPADRLSAFVHATAAQAKRLQRLVATIVTG